MASVIAMRCEGYRGVPIAFPQVADQFSTVIAVCEKPAGRSSTPALPTRPVNDNKTLPRLHPYEAFLRFLRDPSWWGTVGQYLQQLACFRGADPIQQGNHSQAAQLLRQKVDVRQLCLQRLQSQPL